MLGTQIKHFRKMLSSMTHSRLGRSLTLHVYFAPIPLAIAEGIFEPFEPSKTNAELSGFYNCLVASIVKSKTGALNEQGKINESVQLLTFGENP